MRCKLCWYFNIFVGCSNIKLKWNLVTFYMYLFYYKPEISDQSGCAAIESRDESDTWTKIALNMWHLEILVIGRWGWSQRTPWDFTLPPLPDTFTHTHTHALQYHMSSSLFSSSVTLRRRSSQKPQNFSTSAYRIALRARVASSVWFPAREPSLLSWFLPLAPPASTRAGPDPQHSPETSRSSTLVFVEVTLRINKTEEKIL